MAGRASELKADAGLQPGWLEGLLASFADPEMMVVAGITTLTRGSVTRGFDPGSFIGAVQAGAAWLVRCAMRKRLSTSHLHRSGRVPPPRVWVLTGERRGDANQLIALAEALGEPFRVIPLRYRRHWKFLSRRFPERFLALTLRSRLRLHSPWPALVLGAGRRSVSVARAIRRRSGGATRIVRIGNPRADPDSFDLLVTTPEHPPRAGPAVLNLPLALCAPALPEPLDPDWADHHPRPWLLFAVGGPVRRWTLDQGTIASAVQSLDARALLRGGTLFVVPSPRTPPDLVERIRAETASSNSLLIDGDKAPRFAALLAAADEHFVTGDSVSMLSEAILTGKPVGLIELEPRADEKDDAASGHDPASRKDLARFWSRLRSDGLAGTLETPLAAAVRPDPMAIAAAAVRKLLER